jgi:hypothetical protein
MTGVVMDNDLGKKITEDLEKSGFASEMKVVATFWKSKWNCKSGLVYFDHDEKKSRELDFRGIHIYSQDNLMSEFVILGEVKKSQHPWVVFKRGDSEIPAIELFGGEDILCAYNLPMPRTHTLARAEFSLTARNRWQGYGIHETFKNPDQPSRWFSAFVATSKAVENSVMYFESYFKGNKKLKEYNSQQPSYLGILKPVVIIDGSLFSAETTDGQLIVNEIQAASVKFEYKSVNYARNHYLVDLVCINALGDYLRFCEQQHQTVVNQVLTGLVQENHQSETNQEMTLEQAMETELTWDESYPFFMMFS